MRMKFLVLVGGLSLCASMAGATSIRTSSGNGDHGITVDPTIPSTTSGGFEEELGCSSTFYEENGNSCSNAGEYDLLIDVPDPSPGSSYQVNLNSSGGNTLVGVSLVCESASDGALVMGAGITSWLPSDDPSTGGTACSDLTSSLSSLTAAEQGCVSDLVPTSTSGNSFTFTVPSCGDSWIVIDETVEDFATIGPVTATPAPEPGSASLLLVGLLPLFFFRKRIWVA